MAIPGLGVPMQPSDPVYSSSAAYVAGVGQAQLPWPFEDPGALLGRWARSPSKFVGWDTYMEFFGLKGDKALQETEEPQEHVILEFTKEKLRILHRLCWRDGLDCEYTVPLDGSAQPVPPAMVARASSSWKVNDLANWTHSWDDGDGNPLHRGLKTEQKLSINGTDYALRYYRSLIGPQEMRINVEVTYAETGKYAVHTQRFFHRIPVLTTYNAIGLMPAPSAADAIKAGDASAGELVVLPHASNMPAGWQELDESARWEHAEPMPSAGRSSGPFLTSVREAAVAKNVWVCCGVALRADKDQQAKNLMRGVALIGNDGWLHGVHLDADPPAPYVAGAGDWPATQRARPQGVYNTALGNIAVRAAMPEGDLAAVYARMGTEVVIVPPREGAPAGRASISIPGNHLPGNAPPHAHLTRYELCGPEPLPLVPDASRSWQLMIVSERQDGAVEAKPCSVPCA